MDYYTVQQPMQHMMVESGRNYFQQSFDHHPQMQQMQPMYHHGFAYQYHHAPPQTSPMSNESQDDENDGCEMSSDTIEGKKRLIIFPRRKAGQRERDINNVAPVHLTLESIEEIADVPLLVAAKQLGISKTALKNACRHLGLDRWPFRRRMQTARLQSKQLAARGFKSDKLNAGANMNSQVKSYDCNSGNNAPIGHSGNNAPIAQEERGAKQRADGPSVSAALWRVQQQNQVHPKNQGHPKHSSYNNENHGNTNHYSPSPPYYGDEQAFLSAMATPLGSTPMLSDCSTTMSSDDQASPINVNRSRVRKVEAVPLPQQAAARAQAKHAAARNCKEEFVAAPPVEQQPRTNPVANPVAVPITSHHGKHNIKGRPAAMEEDILNMPCQQFNLNLPGTEEASYPQATYHQHQLERGCGNAFSFANHHEAQKELPRDLPGEALDRNAGNAGMTSAELNWVMEADNSMSIWDDESGMEPSALPSMYHAHQM
eukprot:CAMPEP_0181320220 /NCGR_PEP_ID=MMETSP1101-20121128/18001_1 /TAXON_ID=46948 /ORGANISM="Rhodomonas abbreviata, Strain Caron Lab Isolate" /LENGTH=484 /DNA_ID=CAMNT_0023427897 /DNA_START=115 /DNA_END=1569 /DNA_ORIENTATION=+